ncbi:MAG: 2-hydroxyacyl-CoA dehydratase [Pseudobutyrivibrio sp.]|nr:2-hydroxyacyl-CoA dehydratase [Pseudobutyrivibrio sp.]
MRDLKNLQYFEDLLRLSNNRLVVQAKNQGRIFAAYMCENTPEPLLNLGNCFGVRLTAPNTGSTDIATYYMSSFMCEAARALLERSIEGGYNYADCLIAPDGCTMINRCAENIELLGTIKGNERFFVEHHETPLKADDNGVDLLVLQCKNHILTPLHEKYGIDISDTAIRHSVGIHNQVCELITAIGQYRKELLPRITGYEFAVITMATYVCPKDMLIDKLQETLDELATREPDSKPYRARLLVTGSELDDIEFIRIIEECGALVCADRFCFGSTPGREVIELTDDEDALTQVCRHYVYKCQCPRQMNMEKVYGRKENINRLALEYKADGIIYNQIKFCDPWAYERAMGTAMLRDDFGFPVLSLERPYNSHSSLGQIRTRIQAFIESIEIKKIQEEHNND